jgi:large subunit ribosomal protein L21
LDEIMMINDGKSAKVGTPLVKGAKVTAKVVEQYRDEKVVIFKKKRRQNYRRTKGHRQHLTLIEITDIKAA